MSLSSILLILITCALVLACSGGGATASGPAPQAPTVLRKDLKFGYFGSTLSEVVDHTNIYFATGWREDQQQQIVDAVNAGLPVILYLHGVAEDYVRTQFDALKKAGVLANIVAIYPIDEPREAAPVVATNAMLRRVMAEYGMSAKLMVIYSVGSYPAIESYDWVGFDNYPAGSSIFTNGDYNKFKSLLRPDQRIVLVPGGCDRWRNDPEPFFNVAETDPQVLMVMPFTWIDDADPANGATAGIRSNGMAPAYKSAGLRIKNG